MNATLPTRMKAWRAWLPCPHCAGTGQRVTCRHPEGAPCARCGGTGTGCTQAEAARIAEMNPDHWRRYESGRRVPGPKASERIERAMSMPLPDAERPHGSDSSGNPCDCDDCQKWDTAQRHWKTEATKGEA
jgi:hypothetical protein